MSAVRSKRTFHSHLLACRISFTFPYDESAQIRLQEFSDLSGKREKEAYVNHTHLQISAYPYPTHMLASAYAWVHLSHPPVYTPGNAHTRCMIIIPDMLHMSIYSGESYENRIYF